MPDTYVQRSVGRRWRRDGEDILLARHVHIHGRACDLVDPTRFTEKVTRRMVKLHRREKPLLTQLSDKYAARARAGSQIGMHHLTGLLWHGTDSEAIPFDDLPQRYVIKTNHACKQVILVNGAPDRRSVKQKLSRWLTENFYWVEREAHYRRIQPRILIEEYLQEADGSAVLDYRHYCFGGEVALILVSRVHHHRAGAWFDPNWNPLDLGFHHHSHLPRLDVPRPQKLDEMLHVARLLSKPFDFVRVDLYNVAGRILFGEMSFTPNSAQARFLPDEWDLTLGKLWHLRKAPQREAAADRKAMARNVEYLAERERLDAAALAQTVEELHRATSPDDLVIVVDDGQLGESLALDRKSLPFTERDGAYWGPPPNGMAAIAELQRLQSLGATAIAFMRHAFWWLDHYVDFECHLRQGFRCLVDNERLVVFRLGEEATLE